MGALRLLVADDHEIVRKGLCALIQGQPGWSIAAEASDGREAVAKAREVKPDVTILDISMPALNGLDAARQISKAVPQTKVLILTVHESAVLTREILAAGARGYLLKTDPWSDFVAAVEAMRRNKPFFTPRVAETVLDGYLGGDPHFEGANGGSDGPLTPRQREVVQLLAEGKSSKEVAAILGMSVKTAETHRANIMRRLSCHSVTELVRYAVRNHMIEP